VKGGVCLDRLKPDGRFAALTVINHMSLFDGADPRATADAFPPDSPWVQTIAQHVAQLLHDEPSPPHRRQLVDAATLADEPGVDRTWVYEHRDQLGGIKLGTGSKPRLRFDPQLARASLGHAGSKSPAAPSHEAGDMPRRKLRSKRASTPGRVLTVRTRASQARPGTVI
jgi:hypothetical protein